MEHPHARGGHVTGPAAWTLLNAFGRRHRVGKREVAALIKPSPVEQEKRAILNTSVTITARQPASAKQTLGMRLYSNLKHSVAPTSAVARSGCPPRSSLTGRNTSAIRFGLGCCTNSVGDDLPC